MIETIGKKTSSKKSSFKCSSRLPKGHLVRRHSNNSARCGKREYQNLRDKSSHWHLPAHLNQSDAWEDGKYCVIFDSSTQTWMNKVVLNHITTTKLEAAIDFGKSKLNLLINIYKWRISFPRAIIYTWHFRIIKLVSTSHGYPAISLVLLASWCRIGISYQQVMSLVQIPQPALGIRSGAQLRTWSQSILQGTTWLRNIKRTLTC